MGSWRSYVFSIIACSFICGIVSRIVPDTKRKELMRLICGMFLAVVILKPLAKTNIEEILSLPAGDWNCADIYIAEGEKTASEAQAKCIKAFCEEYIMDKAKELGTEISANVSLNEELLPTFVEISGDLNPDIEMQLQKILTTDLDIPKENQKWTWNQGNNSSFLP